MSYIKRDNVPARPGETVVELDTGGLVAVSCDRKLVGDRIVFHVHARAIDTAGEQLVGADGRPVLREFKHSAPADAEAGDTARQCLLAALGEPCELSLSSAVLASYSIRVALGAATAVGQVDVGAVL